MTNVDAVLQWGPVVLALAALTAALLTVGVHVLAATLRVSLRNRRVRRAMLPVVELGEAAPSGVVCIEGVLALPPRSALHDRDDVPAEELRPVVETPGRRVRLDGPIRVLAGTLDVIAPEPAGRRVMRGARVRARGVIRLEANAESDTYRGESATWSLAPEVDAVEVASLQTRRVRGHRKGLSAALATVAATIPVGVAAWYGARVFARVGAPTVALSSVRGDVARWRRVWSHDDRNRLALAALSPLLREKVRAQRAREEEFQTAFPPLDRDEAARLAAVLRANGDCVHEAILALRTGYPARAVELSASCAETAADAVARDAECLLRPASRQCLLSYLRGEEAVARWSAALSARDARRGATGGEGLHADDPGVTGPEADGVGCAIVTSMRDPRDAEGASIAPLPASVWDDLLSIPDPACRVLGATRAARRDAAAMGALVEARGTEATRSLVEHARAYVQLTGIDSGRITGPLCAARAPSAQLEVGYLAANPGLALAFLEAAVASPCGWVGDHTYFIAAQAFARFMSEAGTPATGAACGGGRCEGLDDRRGWMWQLDAVRAHRTLSRSWGALHRFDPRYTPRRLREHDAGAGRLLDGLPHYVAPVLDRALERDGNWPGDFTWGSVARAMAALRSPSTWSMRAFPEARRLHQHQMDRAAVWSAPEAHSQERAPLFAALVDYWRTGVWTPPRDAAALYRGARMRRAVDAAAGWNTEDVLRVIGPPDDEGVQIMAAVAPRLSGRRPSAEHWVRAALGYAPPSTRSAAAQVIHLARVVSVARRLRLAPVADEAESRRAAALDALLARDPWVSAVLDGSRAAR